VGHTKSPCLVEYQQARTIVLIKIKTTQQLELLQKNSQQAKFIANKEYTDYDPIDIKLILILQPKKHCQTLAPSIFQ
jgi:hypothetical protein